MFYTWDGHIDWLTVIVLAILGFLLFALIAACIAMIQDGIQAERRRRAIHGPFKRNNFFG